MVRQMKAVTVLAVVVGVVLAACNASGADRDTELLNALRARHGLQQLTRVTLLDAKAVARAQIMAREGVISHTSEASLVFGVPRGWSRIGENVAIAATVDRAQTILEGSPEHFANMLHPGNSQVGVGVVEQNGRVFMVQVFVAR